MPDAALEATERQFCNLLSAAAGPIELQLTYYSLPEIERAPTAREHINSSYFGIEELWKSRPDAVIVTGAEPREPKLSQEPYWSRLVELIDWVDKNTISSMWSCLAAHAAVLKMDGIARHPLPDKCSGVFDHQADRAHLLTRNVVSQHPMPHSRWNEVRRTDLEAHGYAILTDSAEAGVNLFSKQEASLMLFWQGHPEYDERSLLKEYQRDISRFLRGERSTYPIMPFGYFDAASVERLLAFESRARTKPSAELISHVPLDAATASLVSTWRPAAIQIYGNWLRVITEAKSK